MLRFPQDFPAGANYDPPARLLQLQNSEDLTRVLMPSGQAMWFLTRYEDVLSAFLDSHLSRALAYPDSPRLAGDDITSVAGCILNLEGKAHRVVRSAISPLFSDVDLRHWKTRIFQLGSKILISALLRSEVVDLVSDFAQPLIGAIGQEVLGITSEDTSYIRSVLAAALSLLPGDLQVAEATNALVEVAAHLLERPLPQHGLLATVATALQEGVITPEQAAGTSAMLVFNALDPMSPPIVLGIGRLIREMHQGTHVLDDRGLGSFNLIAKEIFRYYNNGPINLPRIAISPVSIGGVTLQVGDAVVTSALAASWDHKKYHQPSRFDISRPKVTPLTFGAGRHRCLGEKFAYVVLESAVDSFFSTLRNAHLSPIPVEISGISGLVNERFLFAPPVAPIRMKTIKSLV